MTGLLVLLTNDDGHRAAGLLALRTALSRIAHVVTVAPATEMSGVSHAITLTRPLTCERIDEDLHAVDGTPTDCVNIALHRILERRPDVLVSGVNHGANLGDDVSYSATVGAAHEGALAGLPSIAVSQLKAGPSADFTAAGEVTSVLVEALGRGRCRLLEGTFLNVNVPSRRPVGVDSTRLARRVYLDPIEEHAGEGGRAYYWVGGRPSWQSLPGTDHHAVVTLGHVSLTLLGTDLSLAVPGSPAAAPSDLDRGLGPLLEIVGPLVGAPRAAPSPEGRP